VRVTRCGRERGRFLPPARKDREPPQFVRSSCPDNGEGRAPCAGFLEAALLLLRLPAVVQFPREKRQALEPLRLVMVFPPSPARFESKRARGASSVAAR